MIKLERNGDSIRSLTTAVRERLRADIAACRIVPGEKLHIARLAGQYGVSLGAVREALARLVAEGWVEAEDQRGFRASPVSIDDLLDITRTGIEIESIALRWSIELGGAEWEDRVRRTYRELSEAPLPPPGEGGPLLDAWKARHGRFHAALVAGCGSEWLLRFRNMLFEQSERYRVLSYSAKPRDLATEHRMIAEATLDREPDAAVKALSEHFTMTAEAIVETFSSEAGRWSEVGNKSGMGDNPPRESLTKNRTARQQDSRETASEPKTARRKAPRQKSARRGRSRPGTKGHRS